MPRRRYEVRVEMAGLFNMLGEVKVQFGWWPVSGKKVSLLLRKGD